MARALTAGMQSAVAAKELKPFLLFRAYFDSGTLNLWSGFGAMSLDGVTYTGSGDLIALSAIRETLDLEAIGATFTLAGAPQELLAIAHNEDYQDRPVEVYLGMFNNAWITVADPYLLYEGRMDVMTLEEQADTATISLQAENILIDLTIPTELSYTPGDQASFYPGDTGFDLVASLQEKELLLGG